MKTDDAISRGPRPPARWWPAWVVLGLALSATLMVCLWSKRELQKQQLANFNQAIVKSRHTMEAYFSAYINILTGLASVLSLDETLTADYFKSLLEVWGLRSDHPGIFDMGYIARVRATERPALVTRMQSMGFEGAALTGFPPDTAEDYVLLYWDNFQKDHVRGDGVTRIEEARRVRAMNFARDQGSYACSEKLSMLMGGTQVGPEAFVMYVPVYHSGKVPATIEQRREALQGFIFTSFIISDFWSEVYRNSGETNIEFRIYDGLMMEPAQLWYASHGTNGTSLSSLRKPQFNAPIPVGGLGREWTFYYASTPGFEATPEARMPYLILAGGTGLSAVLFLLFLLQTRARLYSESLTERLRQSQETIAVDKERLAVILGSIGDGVITADDQDRITFINPKAERLLNHTEPEARGQTLGALLNAHDPHTLAPFLCPTQQVFQTGTAWRATQPLALSAQENLSCLILPTVSPLRDALGVIRGVVVVLRDVTERQRLLEEQFKSSKLESIGVLAGGIAHDFNNLLSAIIGNLSLASLEPGATETTRTCLDEASSACHRARELTQQLLTFAKGGAPVRQAARLENTIRESARLATQGTNAQCQFSLPTDLWPVAIDVGQIRQVLHNIALNAVQAMPEGGLIDLRAANLHLADPNPHNLPPGRYVRISIQDQGTGIKPEYLGKVFDPYFTTKQLGSGLGLATAHSIVKRHEGTIAVSSNLTAGAQFDVYLPATDQTPSLNNPPPPTLIRGSGTILVMDDELPVRTVLDRMLKRLGYQVILAQEGVEAVRHFQQALTRQEPIAAVILDLTVVEGMGGLETLRNLQALDPQVKAIVSSGYSTDPIMASYQQHGFRGVVVKPYNLIDLSQSLHQVLSA